MWGYITSMDGSMDGALASVSSTGGGGGSGAESPNAANLEGWMEGAAVQEGRKERKREHGSINIYVSQENKTTNVDGFYNTNIMVLVQTIFLSSKTCAHREDEK